MKVAACRLGVEKKGEMRMRIMYGSLENMAYMHGSPKSAIIDIQIICGAL